ncbi:MAG TPA: hypothetical protein VMK66_07235, partial [Myxococcales bacterium]|nr:hypothetical protein [Myxococcales bacterium]
QARRAIENARRGMEGKKPLPPDEDERDLEKLQEYLSSMQEKLGREQEKIGREQEKMGREQERLAKQAQGKIEEVIEASLKDGAAQRMN